MTQLKTFPWLSLSIMLITYVVFGWHIAAVSINWSHSIVVQTNGLGLGLKDESLMLAIHLFAILIIVLTSLALTAPLTLMTFFVSSWIKSELQSIMAMIAWSFLLVLILRWFDVFIQFLVLLSAAILGRLELRYIGYSRSQTLGILTILGLIGFGSGAMSYFYYFDPSVLKIR
ncbi:MAG: hypothetical protein ACKO2V_05770 [Snowella sp.]